jgi:hypothetical protein
MRKWIISFLLIGVFGAKSTFAQTLQSGFQITHPQPGATVIADDSGAWGGQSMGTSHQNTYSYQTKKTIYIPNGALDGIAQARVRVFMALLDNAAAEGTPEPSPLNEAFQLIVNGNAHSYNDNEPFLRGVGIRGQTLTWRWTDFVIPVSELHSGENTFIFHKTQSDTNNDYLYIGIDNTVSHGNSQMSVDGGITWTSKSLNTINATGEYMARLVLLKETPQAFAVWTPQKITDAQHLIGYAGVDKEANSSYLNLELDLSQIDASQPYKVTIRMDNAATAVRWRDKNNKPIDVKSTFTDGVLSANVAVGQDLAKVEIPLNGEGTLPVSEVRFDYWEPIGLKEERVNMAPRVQPAKGKPIDRAPKVLLTANGFTVQNSTQIAQYETKPNLRLISLRNEYLQKNILAHPEATHLFLTEIKEKRYGAEDWKVQDVKVLSSTQIRVQLTLPQEGLSADFTITVDAQKMSFGLKITNVSKSTLSWKTAFPQIGGLELSQSADDDYYLFPLWGGVIASQNVSLKTNYGDETAWWQMVDVFSPESGAGLMLRNLDESGLYKGIALRKGLSTIAGGSFAPGGDSAAMTPDMSWNGSLKAEPGTAMDFEYLKYTRPAGGNFTFPESAIEMHGGDWHNAMQTYADWAHKVWKWRPFPSKLHDVWNIDVAGWAQDALYKDGKWRTDFINDKSEVTELMSWWQWSEKGPWQVPIDQLETKLGKAFYDRYKSYFVVNPANGKLEYTVNRGDYDYNTDWGGLLALKKELQTMRDGGQLPMFYMDPILADDNTELGHKYGPKYGVMNPRWKDSYNVPLNPPGYVAAYGGYNMCTDTEWYQNFVVQQATRIVRDTGVDGIRFDEFGHVGYTCFNPQHEHIFGETGQEARLQSISRMCKLVHESVDKIKPDFVLTAEYPGYDHLAANLEGSINYESESHVFESFRPIPLNVFRFYFPESKPFDLDERRTPRGEEWRFWNASGAFQRLHPPLYHRILLQNGDAFGSRTVTPLVPTLAKGVYANRFDGGGKTITLLYNASGFTVDAPLISAPAKTAFHYFDLLNGKKITPEKDAISMKLQPDKVAAIALLPKVLLVTKTAGGWQIELNRAVPNASVSLCDEDGAELSRQIMSGQKILLKAPEKGNVVYIKLFSGKYLLDAQ